MWTRNHSIFTNEVSKDQLWDLFADVNNWPNWDEGLEKTEMKGEFAKGNHFMLKPKGGPKVKVRLLQVVKPDRFTDVTYFWGAKMYDEHIFEQTDMGLKITNIISVTGILGFIWIKLVANGIAETLPQDMQKQVEAAKKR